MKQTTDRLLPFISFGIGMVVLCALLVVFSYLLIWGALVGLVLFAAAKLRKHFFSAKNPVQTTNKTRQGLIIEHSEIK